MIYKSYEQNYLHLLFIHNKYKKITTYYSYLLIVNLLFMFSLYLESQNKQIIAKTKIFMSNDYKYINLHMIGWFE